LFNVVQREEIGVLEIQALDHTAKLDIQVAANKLESDLLASVTGRVIDLAEASPANAPLDGVAVQRAGTALVEKLHGSASRLAHISGLGDVQVHGLMTASF
jgi:hypothetical protein